MTDLKPDILAIFSEAIGLASDEERSRYLDQVCNADTSARERIDSLLRAHFQECKFLGGQSPTPAAIDLPLNGLPRTQIGPYKLREQIGEGGMGVVYVAEQTEPVKRKVALKIIKPGMATKDVVARFEAERQALAMMDHPNIAKVHDGGATDSGQPYFVMKLVQGLSITEYCDQHRLFTEERLKLFATVCRAVQHAHQKGIIHRDIKPSNIIVSEIDDTAVPKVIDFGVAKAIGQTLTEGTIYTHFSQMVGTPLYMSPEQTGLGVVDIDTRSDVYSLGVLLYELLTGNTPFDGKALKEVGFDEMRRIIREVDPPKPSAMVNTLNAEALSTIFQRRGSDPRKLSENLSGELDWIVMKALEKDRSRRYETVSDVVADIERHLNDEPVSAVAPTFRYQLQKVARRYRKYARAAVAVSSLLILVSLIAIWQAVSATHAQHSELQHRLLAQKKQREAEAAQAAEAKQKFAARQSEATIRRLLYAAAALGRNGRPRPGYYFADASHSKRR